MESLIEQLFESIKLEEGFLSKDVYKYTSKDCKSLKKDLILAKNCFNDFYQKYQGFTKGSFSIEECNHYYNEYHSCITYLIILLAMYGLHSPPTYQAIFNILDRLNNISDNFFPRSMGVYTSHETLLNASSDFRKSNADLRRIFHESLKEHKLSQFDTSQITNKSISKYGLNEAKLIDVTLDNNSITLQFEVNSTGDNTHVDLTGSTQVFLKRGYSVIVQFLNTKNYISLSNIDKNTIVQQFNNVINNCDAKVYCDCPAFYWQGMAEKNAAQGDSYFGFHGTHGKNYWQGIHNMKGPQACKHIWSVEYFVYTEQKQISDKILSKVQDSSKVYDNIIN